MSTISKLACFQMPITPLPRGLDDGFASCSNYGAFRNVLSMLRCTFRVHFEAGTAWRHQQTDFGEGGVCVGPGKLKASPLGGVLIFLDTYRTAAQFVPLLFVWSFFGTQINLIVFLSPKSAPLRGALLGLVCVRACLGCNYRRSVSVVLYHDCSSSTI